MLKFLKKKYDEYKIQRGIIESFFVSPYTQKIVTYRTQSFRIMIQQEREDVLKYLRSDALEESMRYLSLKAIKSICK